MKSQRSRPASSARSARPTGVIVSARASGLLIAAGPTALMTGAGCRVADGADVPTRATSSCAACQGGFARLKRSRELDALEDHAGERGSVERATSAVQALPECLLILKLVSFSCGRCCRPGLLVREEQACLPQSDLENQVHADTAALYFRIDLHCANLMVVQQEAGNVRKAAGLALGVHVEKDALRVDGIGCPAGVR